jgi:PAS domain S-box-containing protein
LSNNITTEQIFSYQDIVLDTIKEPIFAIDTSHKFVVWNKAISDLTNLSIDDVLDRPIDSVFSFNNIDIKSTLINGKSFQSFVVANNLGFHAFLEPLTKDGELAGFRGGLYSDNERILTSLPREYLVEVINASPMSAIVFNLDGSIMYSNNAHRKMWNLDDDDMAFLNSKYNLFLDEQLRSQGLMPFIDSAFRGEIHQSPVFKYSFFSAKLGRPEKEKGHWLIAHIFPIRDQEGNVLYVVLNFIDVTEHYNLEEELKENKERLHLALKGSEMGLWDWNLETGGLIYNETWANMLGYDLEEAYTLTWENLLHPDDRERALKDLYNMTEGRTDEYDSEFRLKTKNGNWKWILDRGKVVERSSNGKAIRVSGTHIDINERKINEETLKENEDKYRKLVENAPIGIAILVDEKVLYANKKLARMGGFGSIEAMIGMSVKEFIPDDDEYSKFKERESLVINKGENAPLRAMQYKTVDGKSVDVEVVSIPVTFEGKPAMQVLLHDISDRNHAIYELAQSRELLNQLFENSPMGIVLLDEQFMISNINKGFESIFGYSKDEIKGKSLMDFIISPELVEEADRLDKSAIKGEIDHIESYRYNKSGEKVHVLIYSLPVMEADEPIGIYGIYIDIGQRINAEEELKTRNLELDNFVYKVSHDLRAPLASILGLINLTKLEESQADQATYVDLMEGQVNKLDHFIRDILSHSKNLKMSVSTDKIDFEEIVLKCFEDLSYLKATSKVVRKISISKGEFYSDKWRINEIFRNLIGNAIKYRNTEANENIVDVNISIDEKGSKIIVTDNGIGIAEDKLPHVMEMFYRGSESSDGSGIGLYIVQKAVEKIEGSLEIESKPNEGTKFKIWLPTLSNLLTDQLN